MPHAGRLFMKQFLPKQTMHAADEAASGGLVFHWYCIVNSRPKSHSDSQPTPFRSSPSSSSPIFATVLPFSLSPPPSLSLCFLFILPALPSLPLFLSSYRIAKLFTNGAPRKLGELEPPSAEGFHWTSSPLHSLAAVSRSRSWIFHFVPLTALLCINCASCSFVAAPCF